MQRGFDHPFFRDKRGIEVIAHRGGGGEWPGETIYALQQAVSIGADVLEMDVRNTADDDLVLMHNPNALETTGVDKRVDQMSSLEIQQLDAAYWWRKAGKVFPPGARLGVPRLEDVLREFRNQRLNIEIKPPNFPIRLIKKFAALLREYEATNNVLVASGWNMNLVFFRRECPEVATSASVAEMIVFRYLNYRPNADAIQTVSRLWRFERITKEFLERAHKKNLLVHGWTVNTPEEMGRLMGLEIDGIITDYPSVLLELMGRKRGKSVVSGQWS
jgi:glycerophosphoryl diester phosphodiesterase